MEDFMLGKKKKDIVTIFCDGEEEKEERLDAMSRYLDAMCCCEGSEKERYTNIYLDLKNGRKMAWDKGFVPKGYHLCPYCKYELAEGEFKDLLCSYCREDFGHALATEL